MPFLRFFLIDWDRTDGLGNLKKRHLGILTFYQLGSVATACEAQCVRKTVHHAIFTFFLLIDSDWIDGLGNLKSDTDFDALWIRQRCDGVRSTVLA